MPSQFFGQFLLEQGVVTSDALLDVLQRQKQIQRPLCALALEQDYLTDDQIDALDRDAEESGSNRIKQAIAKRWISFDRLAQLDRCPFEKWMTLGEALLQEGYLSLAELKDLTVRYRTLHQKQEPVWQAKLGNIREKSVVTGFLQDMLSVFVRYTGQVLTIDVIDEAPFSPSDAWAVAVAQEVSGDRNFYIHVGLPRDLALAVATNMLKADIAGLDAMAVDAIMEFVNVVVGNGCSRLGTGNCRLTTRPPVQLDSAHPITADITHVARVRMSTTKGSMDVSFLFLDSPRS